LSRIGKMPVVIPGGVEATITGSKVTVVGPKGQLIRDFHQDIAIVKEDNQMVVNRPSDQKFHRSLHGLTRALLQNMVDGVHKGFVRNLELVGVGYRASKQGNKLVLTVGYSHPVELDPGTELEVEVPIPTKISIKGIDKEMVGAFAAKVRSVREPEPYKGKGIRYEGEKVIRKVGKAGGKKK